MIRRSDSRELTAIVDRVTVSLIRSQLLSAVPGVTAGFTTREGGHSADALASLNLGLGIGDEGGTVRANRDAVLEALGRPDASWVSLRQVHGIDVVEVTHNAGRSIEADALWTRDRDAVVAVLVADCIPILIADSKGEAVAAVHAGWRGTHDRVAAVAVKRLDKAGFEVARLLVAIGPGIGPCCFEIGEEVAAELTAIGEHAEGAVRRDPSGRITADLWQLNRDILIEAGVAAESIETFRMCTSCNAGFYSHRRDQGKTGRQAGVIGFSNSRGT